jgi:methyl-accepting chemotaxis protein
MTKTATSASARQVTSFSMYETSQDGLNQQATAGSPTSSNGLATWFNNVPISKKLPLIIVGLGLLSVLSSAVLDVVTASHALSESISHKMDAITGAKTAAVEDYLKTMASDLALQAKNPEMLARLRAFTGAYSQIATHPSSYLQQQYIDLNPNPLGQKEKLNFAHDGSPYSAVHAQYHPWLRNLLQAKGYYDIFLIDAQGNCVYSVFKERDFATNLNHGAWRESDLGKLFRKVKGYGRKDNTVFYDFAPYAPSNNAPAGFIGHRISDEQGHFAGVLAFQMPIGKIDELMQTTQGLGKTGESYLLGKDMLLRSDSKFSKEATILKKKMPASFKAGFLKKEAALHTKDEQGRDVFAKTHKLTFAGTDWLVVAQQSEGELNQPIGDMQRDVVIAIVVLALLLSGAGFFLGDNIAKALQSTVKSMKSLAKGNTDLNITGQNRQDEIGDMAKALQVFKGNAIEKDNLTQKLLTLADSLEANVKGAVGVMQQQTRNLSQAASAMATGADTTLHSIQSVYASSSQMSEAANEIASQVAHSHVIVEKAQGQTQKTMDMMGVLDASTQQIGEVVTLIRSITDQTNLLALNATIEASRAGDAGKGFAVVASEVKELAHQTASATEEVDKQVGSIQGESTASIAAMRSISNIVEEVSSSSRSIAAAVEEQTATLSDMSQNLASVAQESDGFKGHIQNVSEAASDLVSQVETVEQQLNNFLRELRQANTQK